MDEKLGTPADWEAEAISILQGTALRDVLMEACVPGINEDSSPEECLHKLFIVKDRFVQIRQESLPGTDYSMSLFQHPEEGKPNFVALRMGRNLIIRFSHDPETGEITATTFTPTHVMEAKVVGGDEISVEERNELESRVSFAGISEAKAIKKDTRSLLTAELSKSGYMLDSYDYKRDTSVAFYNHEKAYVLVCYAKTQGFNSNLFYRVLEGSWKVISKTQYQPHPDSTKTVIPDLKVYL